MKRVSLLATLLAAVLAALLIPAGADASTPGWHTYRISHAGDLATVRCPSSSVCVALSHAGQVLTTKNAGAAKHLRAFLGTRIGCAKCHNHPLERYTQDDYYHFAAFFSQMQMERKDPEKGATVLHPLPRQPNERNRPAGTGQPRTGQFMKPQPLDRAHDLRIQR